MCTDCTVKQVGDAAPVTVTPQMETLAGLIEEWYDVTQWPNHGAGGFLHVVLDDHNIDDEHLDITDYVDFENGTFSDVTANEAYEAGLILGYLRNMTVPQRAVALSMGHGEVLPEGLVA